MKIFISVVIAALLIAPLRAQTSPCVGVSSHLYAQTPVGETSTKVYGPVVPATETWLVDAAGVFVFSDPEINSEFMMEILEPIPEQTGYTDSTNTDACCWRIPLAKITGAFATPELALTRPILLRPGQRLTGRTNNAIGFGINGIYWKYPASCAGTIMVR